mmetsp:Transcript_59558/g.128888  ORF Transcript_59558/g.128888 Transcript_59558/m.128888 type:complete len:206 (-) Transcript_59558:180-797(-)
MPGTRRARRPWWRKLSQRASETSLVMMTMSRTRTRTMARLTRTCTLEPTSISRLRRRPRRRREEEEAPRPRLLLRAARQHLRPQRLPATTTMQVTGLAMAKVMAWPRARATARVLTRATAEAIPRTTHRGATIRATTRRQARVKARVRATLDKATMAATGHKEVLIRAMHLKGQAMAVIKTGAKEFHGMQVEYHPRVTLSACGPN